VDQPPPVLAAMREWQALSDDLVTLVRTFDTAKLDAPSACGDWTNRQLLVHMATGYGVRIAALQSAIDRSSPPPIDADEANAGNVARLSGAAGDEIIAEMVQVRGRVLELLSKLKTEHLSATTALGGGGPLADALAGLNAHDLEHAAELRG
jgi:Mycothiol maleylpyruvate isomerase N-terminal domain